MKMTIESDCPEVTVIENTEHPSIMSIISQPTARTPFAKLSFPKTGSFEVYFRGKIIFSKLRLGIWPHPAMVAKTIRDIMDGNEELKSSSATKFREAQSKPEVPRKPEKAASSFAKKEPEHTIPEPRKQETSKQPEPLKVETPNLAKLPEVAKKDAVPEKKEVKAEVQAKPIEVTVKPAELPAKPVEIPAKALELPVKSAELPVKPSEVQVKHEEMPVKHEEVPVKHEEASVKHEEVPVKHEEVPVKHEEVPVKHVEVPVKHEEEKAPVKPLSEAEVPTVLHHEHPNLPEVPHEDHKVSAKEPVHEENHEEHASKAVEPPENYESQQSHHEEAHEEAGSVHEEYSGDEEAEEDALPPYEITDSFKIELSVGQGKNAKIPLKMKSEEDVSYQVQISNPELVKIEKSEVLVPAGGNEKLKIEILPQDSPGTLKSYVVLSTSETVAACYEIVVEVN